MRSSAATLPRSSLGVSSGVHTALGSLSRRQSLTLIGQAFVKHNGIACII